MIFNMSLFPVVINGAKNGRQKVYHFEDGVAERREYGGFLSQHKRGGALKKKETFWTYWCYSEKG